MTPLFTGLTNDRLNNKLLITPYERTVVREPTPGISYCVEEHELNYTPYDMFAIQLKTGFALQRLYKDAGLWNPVYESILYNGKMVRSLVIYNIKTDAVVPLTDSMVDQIEKELGLSIPFRRHVPLVDLHFPIKTMRGRTLPLWWVRSVITQLQYSSELKAFVKDNYLYLDLTEELEYKDVYAFYMQTTANFLENLYDTGTIRCSSDFASNWNLVPVKSVTPAVGRRGIMLDQNTTLFTCVWDDTRITQDKVMFLYDRLYNEGVRLNRKLIHLTVRPSTGPSTTSSGVGRHFIALKLSFIGENGMSFYFVEDGIMIDVATWEELVEVVNIIESSQDMAEEYEVITRPVYSLPVMNKSDRKGETMRSWTVPRKSYFMDDGNTVIYPVLDYYNPFVESKLVKSVNMSCETLTVLP